MPVSTYVRVYGEDVSGAISSTVFRHTSTYAEAITLSSAAYTVSTDYALSTHFHGANSITTSTFAAARLGTGTPDGTKFLRGDLVWEAPTAAAAWGSITGQVSTQTDITSYAAASTHFHSASDVTTSTFALARLGTGTPSALNFLRGDGTWDSPFSTVVMTNVSTHSSTSAMAIPGMAFSVGALSTYAFKFGVVFATTAQTTGYKLGLVYPAVSTFAAKVSIPQLNSVAHLSDHVSTIIVSGGTVNTSTTPAANTQLYAEIVGVIHPSSAGSLALHAGSEIAGSAISTFAGTFGELRKLT